MAGGAWLEGLQVEKTLIDRPSESAGIARPPHQSLRHRLSLSISQTQQDAGYIFATARQVYVMFNCWLSGVRYREAWRRPLRQRHSH
jgi:hypothetical protein